MWVRLYHCSQSSILLGIKAKSSEWPALLDLIVYCLLPCWTPCYFLISAGYTPPAWQRASLKSPHGLFSHFLQGLTQMSPQSSIPWPLCLQLQQWLHPPSMPYFASLHYFLYSVSNLLYNLILFCLSSSLECELHEGRTFCLVCFLLYSLHLEQYLAHSRHSINICWMNKFSKHIAHTTN